MAERLQQQTGIPFISTLGSVVAALQALGAKRIALGTPYDETLTRRAKAGLESYGFEVVSFDWLRDVRSIFDETEQRVYGLGRGVDREQAQAVFLSGVGMPTLPVLEQLEADLGKPVVSSASATMWNALRVAKVVHPIPGHGRILQLT